MKNTEILEKAIKKAQSNGWKKLDEWDHWMVYDLIVVVHKDGKEADSPPREDAYLSPCQIIFDHDFAKAFWGKYIEITVDDSLTWEIPPKMFLIREVKEASTNLILSRPLEWRKTMAEIYFIEKYKNKKILILPYCKAWEWHLQQMIVEKEPLKYLEKFI